MTACMNELSLSLLVGSSEIESGGVMPSVSFSEFAELFACDQSDAVSFFPADHCDENSEWEEDIPENFKVAGFQACYSPTGRNDGYCEYAAPLMTADFVKDLFGTPIIVKQKAHAEAFRRYADEIIGVAFMPVRNPFGCGWLFLYMEANAQLTPNGHRLFARIANYLNSLKQVGIIT